MLGDPIPFQDLDYLESRRLSDGVAAKGVDVLARRLELLEPVVADHGGNGESATHGLRQHQKIRDDIQTFEREHPPRAPETRLNLVENQGNPEFVTDPAHLLYKEGREWDLSAVYSSPLKRARSTAQCIADRFGLSVITLDRLNDMNFGQWEGLLVSEVREKHAQLFNEWRHNPDRFVVPGGESLDEVRDRVVATIDELALKHEGQTIAVVSHRVVCKVLLCYLLGLDNSHFWKIAQDSTAVNAFEMYEMIGTGEKRATVTLINDTCHLGKQ